MTMVSISAIFEVENDAVSNERRGKVNAITALSLDVDFPDLANKPVDTKHECVLGCEGRLSSISYF